MKITFKTKKLENSLTCDKGLAKNYGTLAKKIKQRMTQLESAENLATIKALSVLRLHEHQGKNKGIWSIDVHKNWRILFTISQDDIPTKENNEIELNEINIICIESVEDPH